MIKVYSILGGLLLVLLAMFAFAAKADVLPDPLDRGALRVVAPPSVQWNLCLSLGDTHKFLTEGENKENCKTIEFTRPTLLDMNPLHWFKDSKNNRWVVLQVYLEGYEFYGAASTGLFKYFKRENILKEAKLERKNL